jgi:hypothetical protein
MRQKQRPAQPQKLLAQTSLPTFHRHQAQPRSITHQPHSQPQLVQYRQAQTLPAQRNLPATFLHQQAQFQSTIHQQRLSPPQPAPRPAVHTSLLHPRLRFRFTSLHHPRLHAPNRLSSLSLVARACILLRLLALRARMRNILRLRVALRRLLL